MHREMHRDTGDGPSDFPGREQATYSVGKEVESPAAIIEPLS